jgi:hypothetical protein
MPEDSDVGLNDLAATITGLEVLANRRLKHLEDLPLHIQQLWAQIVNIKMLVQFGEKLNMDIAILKPPDRLNAQYTLNRISAATEEILDDLDKLNQRVTSEALKEYLSLTKSVERINVLSELAAQLVVHVDLLQAQVFMKIFFGVTNIIKVNIYPEWPHA